MSKHGKRDKDGQPSDRQLDETGGKDGEDGRQFDWRAAMLKVKCYWQTHEGLSVLTSIIVIVVAVLFSFPLLSMVISWTGFPSNEVILRVLLLIFIVILISSIIVFTKPLPDLEDNKGENTDKKNDCLDNASLYLRLKRQWMTLAYSFMIFSLVSAVLPFTLDLIPEPEEGAEYIKYINETIDKPITVFLGCVLDSSGVPNALGCFPDGEGKSPKLSWVMHIGGSLTAFKPDDRFKVSNLTELESEIKALEADLVEQRKAEQSARQLFEETSREFERLSKSPENAAVITSIKTQMENAKTGLEEREKVVKKTQHDIAYLSPFRQGNPSFGITGGLVVPFYLVVFSMVGAAISLTRRIPEYQKQAVKGYVGTKDAPYLPPRMLREYLVFQIIQFISAPFLATVAYFAIEPGTTTTTVALAFAAGFSSETVLLWIRGVVDKVRPEVAPEKQTGSVVGSIPEMKSMKAAEIEKKVTISVVGRHDLRAAFAEGGQFVIDSVPIGELALEVTKIKEGDKEKEIVFRKITVLTDKAVPVLIEFAAV